MMNNDPGNKSFLVLAIVSANGQERMFLRLHLRATVASLVFAAVVAAGAVLRLAHG
ncbi:hypothetical protein [Luteolibacter soli]|uniref:Uncharacterized protein n=1 Tax=Luteolibacter soli TaxID=3135280 RepID=A0ABU9AQ73_9BACT